MTNIKRADRNQADCHHFQHHCLLAATCRLRCQGAEPIVLGTVILGAVAIILSLYFAYETIIVGRTAAQDELALERRKLKAEKSSSKSLKLQKRMLKKEIKAAKRKLTAELNRFDTNCYNVRMTKHPGFNCYALIQSSQIPQYTFLCFGTGLSESRILGD